MPVLRRATAQRACGPLPALPASPRRPAREVARARPHRPEPPQRDRDPEHLAEERELARSAKLAGLAAQRAADLGRLLGGQNPDGYTLDLLDHLAPTLKGWGIRMAFGTGDTDLIAELTGRQRTAIQSLGDLMRRWHQQHPDTPRKE